MIWKTIQNFEAYEISTEGTIRRDGKIRKQDIKNGYKVIRLSREGKMYAKSVHRLVWKTFRGDILEGLHINHKNRNRFDNRIENLEPLSPEDNNNHYKKNLTFRGSLVNTSKFTETQVREIRRRRESGETRRSLAAEYGVAESSITRITTGKHWSHIK